MNLTKKLIEELMTFFGPDGSRMLWTPYDQTARHELSHELFNSHELRMNHSSHPYELQMNNNSQLMNYVWALSTASWHPMIGFIWSSSDQANEVHPKLI